MIIVLAWISRAVATLVGGQAERYGIARPSRAWSSDGGVAHLVERRNGIAKVRGSTPLASTKTPPQVFAQGAADTADELRDVQSPNPPSVEAAISLVVAAKQNANCRPTYVRSLRQYLSQFGIWFGPERPLSEVTVEALEDWFAKRGEKPVTMAGNIGRLSALFSFGVRKRWIERNPCDYLERPRLDARTPRILTPSEAATILRACQDRWPRFLPALVLMLFAGVRPYEVQRIKWENINFEDGVILIDGAVSKVRSRRVVRIRDATRAWLEWAHQNAGELPCRSHRRFIRRLASVIGGWSQDVLRHSACSYLMAIEPDACRISTELGNSPAILARHYLSLVTKRDAAAFWGIRP